jgi:Protein of unknown function (DUF2865)
MGGCWGVALLRRRSNEASNWRAAVIAGALCGVCLAALPRPALAGGFFDFLFGDSRPNPPPHAQSYGRGRAASSRFSSETAHEHGSARTAAFCVRLCDGEAFPMAHMANATPVETCHAMCPASPTKVFFGSAIDTAVAGDGARYSTLDTAYLYHKHLVADCTCNGRDALGLVPLKVTEDPTLRPGDIVVTANGLVAYAGKNGLGQAYTPVDPSDIMTALNSVKSPPPRRARGTQPPDNDNTGSIVESQNAPPQYLPAIADLRGQFDR